MELTTLLFLGFFAAVALLNYTLPRVLRLPILGKR